MGVKAILEVKSVWIDLRGLAVSAIEEWWLAIYGS